MLARFAPAVVPSLVLSALDGETREVAAFAGGGAAIAGVGLVLSMLRVQGPHLVRAEVMAVVALTWLLVGLLGGAPFVLLGFSPVDAAFESMSGITTTGATVLTEFDRYGRGFFLWRAVLHWLGGLGVIALFVAVLPRLGIAGRQLFFAEASTASGDELAPRVRRLSGRLWAAYAVLTLAEIAILVWQGMPPFDAVCNAMATMSAGGFSPNASSIAGYGLPACEWTIAVFMLLAGGNLALHWRAITGRPFAHARDPEFRVFAGAAVLIAGAVSIVLAGGLPGEPELRRAFFQVTSLISSTGFASEDFNLWADGARSLLLAAMLIGGCAGSTSGGPKVVRYMLVAKHCRREMVRAVHPQAVVPVRLGRVAVPEEVVRAVVTFVVVYVATWLVVALLLALLGLGMVSALAGALACLSNSGPGLEALGPMGSYQALPAASKSLLVFTMWIGRLEVVTVLALLRPDVLRRVRWR
jgi:trk system potassium uptake protein TrkH